MAPPLIGVEVNGLTPRLAQVDNLQLLPLKTIGLVVVKMIVIQLRSLDSIIKTHSAILRECILPTRPLTRFTHAHYPEPRPCPRGL